MTLQATYSTTTPAFRLTTTPDSGVALPLTDPSALGSRPLAALLQADTHDIRFTVDGTAPTSSVGMLLVAAAAPFFYTGDLGSLRFIQTESGSKLNVVYIASPENWADTSGVTTFNDRAAAVTLESADVTDALTFTPADVAGDTFTGEIDTQKVKATVLSVTQNTAPADGTLAAGECAIWFDSTYGSAKLMFKAKQANGTVKTGSVNVQT